jgi:hypothetical protein
MVGGLAADRSALNRAARYPMPATAKTLLRAQVAPPHRLSMVPWGTTGSKVATYHRCLAVTVKPFDQRQLHGTVTIRPE